MMAIGVSVPVLDRLYRRIFLKALDYFNCDIARALHVDLKWNDATERRNEHTGVRRGDALQIIDEAIRTVTASALRSEQECVLE